MTWQKHIFKKGRKYRVKQSFMSGAATFIAGETLVFLQDGYGPYDNSFAYEFHSQTDGQTKVWWLHESQSETSWQHFFEPIDERGAGAYAAPV